MLTVQLKLVAASSANQAFSLIRKLVCARLVGPDAKSARATNSVRVVTRWCISRSTQRTATASALPSTDGYQLQYKMIRGTANATRNSSRKMATA